MPKKANKLVLDQVWHVPQQRGRFLSENSPPPPEVKQPGDDGPTPIKGKTSTNPILEKDLPHKIIDDQLMKELDGGVKSPVPAEPLLNHVFPPQSLPDSIDEIYAALQEKVLAANPTFTEKNWWKKWLALLKALALKKTVGDVLSPDVATDAGANITDDNDDDDDEDDDIVDDEDDSDDSDYVGDSDDEDMKRPLTKEERRCFVYQSICDAVAEIYPKLKEEGRFWTGYFSTKPLKSDASRIVRKPDMANVKRHIKIPDFKNGGNRQKWKNIAVIGEDKDAPKTDSYFVNHIANELYNKGFCILENQVNRRAVPALTATGDIHRFSHMDRGGAVHSTGFNMKTKPKTFLHALLGLTFAPDEYIGYDPTIEMDEEGNPIRITVGTRTYKIESVIWRTPMIRGRATSCFHVSRSGREYIIKDYWIVDGREPTEVFFLREALAKKVPFIPELYDWENVVINGKIDSSDGIRGVYKPLLNRIHRRLVISNPAVPIYKFESKRELISALRDIVIAHRDLTRNANILHRDISLYNLMIQKEKHPSGLRKGLLIDYDYAKDLDPGSRKLGENINSPEVWPGNVRDTAGNPVEDQGRLTPPEIKLQKAMVLEFEKEVKIRGHRTGTHPFMSYEILSDKKTVHKARHDLESLFYVLIYLCTMFLGPRGFQKTEGFIPEFLNKWMSLKDHETVLGRDKLGMIHYSEEQFVKIISRYFTTYMKDLTPCVFKMKEALMNGAKEEITHEMWIQIFTETLSELPLTEPTFNPNIAKVIPGVNNNTRSVARHMKENEEEHTFPRGYLSADPNVLTTGDESDIDEEPIGDDDALVTFRSADNVKLLGDVDDLDFDLDLDLDLEFGGDGDDDDITVVQVPDDAAYAGMKDGRSKKKGEDGGMDLATQLSLLSMKSEDGFVFIPDDVGFNKGTGSGSGSSLTFSAGRQDDVFEDSRTALNEEISTNPGSDEVGKGKASQNTLPTSKNPGGGLPFSRPEGGGIISREAPLNMTVHSTASAGERDISISASAQMEISAGPMSIAATAQAAHKDGFRNLSISSVAQQVDAANTPGDAVVESARNVDFANLTTANIIPGRTRSKSRTLSSVNGGATAGITTGRNRSNSRALSTAVGGVTANIIPVTRRTRSNSRTSSTVVGGAVIVPNATNASASVGNLRGRSSKQISGTQGKSTGNVKLVTNSDGNNQGSSSTASSSRSRNNTGGIGAAGQSVSSSRPSRTKNKSTPAAIPDDKNSGKK